MFSTIASAIRSRGAIALVGAGATGLALRSRSYWKGVAEEQYQGRLHEEAKVTELTKETQVFRATLPVGEPTPPEAAEQAERAVAIATLSAVCSLVAYAAIIVATGRGGDGHRGF